MKRIDKLTEQLLADLEDGLGLKYGLPHMGVDAERLVKEYAYQVGLLAEASSVEDLDR